MHRGIAGLTAGIAVVVLQVFAQTADQGIGEFESGKIAAAESTLRAASDAEPGDARATYYLVLTLAAQKKLDDATAAVNRLEKSAPDSEYRRLAAARVSLENKEFDAAESSLNEAEKINADSGDLFFLRGMLNAARKNYQAAVDGLEKAIEKQPRNAYAHYYAAIAYNGVKRPDRMVEHFQHFLRLAPDAPEASKVQSTLRAIR